ncbi:hypothetical protein NUU61_008301 [Penicillium alfredii]|uniref:Autophagy-related protein 2 n=1 Tax=Penicillium alfredii TaxID=1506179 RepID=A0A9W9ESD9_9EURO|nr:uncharacterized protein NUU61_008301 [Penicillium alfredii]KAJ5086994.1 hypothetical protein NUU61_008301 [Penicillium alfredii]
MAYFLPSFFQKRLLKYALSRLGLVETEALDPDNLGIGWGQRSTVELRDIGLKLEKLATLLNLPASCELLGARVQFLRITVPADIYSSGIICEASGIDVHLRLLSGEPGRDGHVKTKNTGPSSSAVHDPDTASVLPTPSGLAESFLETEPKEEKEELQAAIASQSQVLPRQSSSFSADEEEELGLGSETLSLPSFVAGFLKGIADRLQLKIKDVAVRLDMELKQDAPLKRQPEDKPDLVSGLLSIREIDVYGVSEFTAGSEDAMPLRKGKRLVSLVGISVGLVSDPVVFSNYSRFIVPASPTTTMHSRGSQPSSRVPSPPPLDSPGSESALAMTQSTIFEPPREGYRENDRENDSHDMGASTFSHDGRFSDVHSETEDPNDRYLADSQIFGADDPFRDNPDYLDSVMNTRLDNLDVERSTTPRPEEEQITGSGWMSQPGSSPHASGNLAPSHDIEHTEEASIPSSSLHGSRAFDSQLSSGAGPSLDDAAAPSTNYPQGHGDYERSQMDPSHHSPTPSSPSESSSVGSHGDLTESKYFSHDEAQSLYMSAISQETGSFMPNMPGAWDSFNANEHAGGVSEDQTLDTPTGASHFAQRAQSEATASTPKLAVTSDSYFADQQTLGDDQAQSQSELTDRASKALSPSLEKASESRNPIFSIDKVLVWLPSNPEAEVQGESSPSMSRQRADSDPQDFPADLQESTIEESILASKTYASTRFRRGSTESRGSSEAGSRPSGHPEKPRHSNNGAESHETAVEVFSAALHFDIATGWLLVKIGQKIMHALGEVGDPSPKQPVPEHLDHHAALGLVVHDVSIKFIEHVVEHSHSSERAGLPLPPSFPSTEDIILQIKASGLKSQLLVKGATTKLNLQVSKFTFGFAEDNLISFNETLKMRESTRDIMTPTQGDISLSLVKSTDSARISISTLPLHLNLNIQRLEEVIGWMGGLSTILELGSSISSVSTVKGGQAHPKKRPRGVHFETPAAAPKKARNASTPWKVNARVGGIVLDVIGETHCLKLNTSAVKLVSRFEGIGVQIDKSKLSGPLPLDESSDAPAKVALSNIRVEFLFSPKEVDLDRLLTLITPSKDKYDEDDDIMLDTLLRQRRQGSVLRVTVAGMKSVIANTAGLAPLSTLGSELGRLSNVTKYLPEDDRPGILTLTLIREFESQIHVGGDVGDINTRLANAEFAYISMPSLVAAQIGTVTVNRNDDEELVGEALLSDKHQTPIQPRPPVLMARFIPDEMDPTFKVKLHHLRVEYTLPSVTAFLGLSGDRTGGDLASDMANSIANLAEQSSHTTDELPRSPSKPDVSRDSTKPTKLAVVFRDCVLGLNPRNCPAKGLAVLSNAKFGGTMHSQDASEATLDIRKASFMIIDDIDNVDHADNLHQRGSAVPQSNQMQAYIDSGYVPVSTISSAMAVVKLMSLDAGATKSLDVELRDDLLILETCADSTQTLISIMNGLQPPTPPNANVKYRTEVMPIQDMLASFSGDAFTADPTLDSKPAVDLGEPLQEEGLNEELEYVSDFYPAQQGAGDGISKALRAPDSNDLLDSFHSQYQISSSITELEFQDDHFARQSAVGGTAHRWDSTHNTYGLSNDTMLQRSPLRVRVRDVHVIWNLFDGYDWQRTRDTISKAVKDVETKATERRARTTRMSPGTEEDAESVIGDFLFNSIYIGIPANKDPRELHREINRDIDDLTSETGSYATSTTVTGTTSRQGRPSSMREKRLRLHRSKYHKMTFELKGVCADLVVFPPNSGETQSSLDVRVNDLEIYDHVPTSTWKKFATYMHEAGEKESGTSMIHLEILTVQPVPELAASEIVLKATVLPLRLHVDQDALDFLSRFFEFRDESIEESSSPGDAPFLQRVEVNAVQVKLDFKPKRVDYAGLRSGRTTEFMNFFVLDGADMVLRHVIIYGVSGFDRLGITLNDIWMPDVKRNQLPGVLAGLAPIRSLVNVGGGVRDLVVVPMREYHKDGRIVRSIQKGALAFAKTTSNELVKLGAKLAIGTQTVLQGAEDLLTTPSASPAVAAGISEEALTDDEAKAISLYADQPVGVVQGLRGAFSGLERDLLLARNAVVAVPGEVVESGSATAAARAVWKRAPTVILRPAIGVSKAVGQTLLGAGNTLDPSNRRKMEDKYKRH